MILSTLPPGDLAAGAAFALDLGCPQLAASWSPEPLVRAAAWLRLGEAHQALAVLIQAPPTARTAVLKARAAWQRDEGAAQSLAEEARRRARLEGDASALIAAVTLLGEQQLNDPFAALRTLAEGLKVAEIAAQPADAHLLAVLAHVQLRLGGSKGKRTADKALARAAPASPAHVLALLALQRQDEALAQATRGGLSPVWWAAFSPAGTSVPSSAGQTAGTEADG